MSEIVGSCYVCSKLLRVGDRVSSLMLPPLGAVELCQGCADDMRKEYGSAIDEVDLDKSLPFSRDSEVPLSGNRSQRRAQKRRK